MQCEYRIGGHERIARITREEEAALARRIQAGLASGADRDTIQDGRSAEDKLIRTCLPLAIDAANQYLRMRPSHLSFDELVAAAAFGLLHAARRFNPAKGRFTTYAYRWTRIGISREIRATSGLIRVPRGTDEAMRKAAKTEGVKMPTHADAALRARRTTAWDGDEAERIPASQDVVQDVIDAEDVEQAKQCVTGLLRCVKAREQDVVTRLYGIGREEETLAQSARSLGISYQSAEWAYKQAIKSMRRKVGANA